MDKVTVDTVNELRNAQLSGYEMIISTEVLSKILVSTPSLMNEFDIYSSAEERQLFSAKGKYTEKKTSRYFSKYLIFFAIPIIIYFFNELLYAIFYIIIVIVAYISFMNRRPRFFYKSKYNYNTKVVTFYKKKYNFLYELPQF